MSNFFFQDIQKFVVFSAVVKQAAVKRADRAAAALIARQTEQKTFSDRPRASATLQAERQPLNFTTTFAKNQSSHMPGNLMQLPMLWPCNLAADYPRQGHPYLSKLRMRQQTTGLATASFHKSASKSNPLVKQSIVSVLFATVLLLITLA